MWRIYGAPISMGAPKFSDAQAHKIHAQMYHCRCSAYIQIKHTEMDYYTISWDIFEIACINAHNEMRMCVFRFVWFRFVHFAAAFLAAWFAVCVCCMFACDYPNIFLMSCMCVCVCL